MRLIKVLFANLLLISVLMVMLGLPMTFMAVARYTNTPVLGTQNDRIETYAEPQKERVPLNAKTQKYYIIENDEDTTVETTPATDLTPEQDY